ncbi:MAG: signal peptidase II [Clostridia bacterium]|nr:signal peptidase II [Clostridia bacterium]
MKEKLVKFFKAVWAYMCHAKIELIVVVTAFALDLITKAIVDATMALGSTVTLIPNFLNFTYTHNYAAAFGSAFGLDGVFSQEVVMAIFIIFAFVAIVLFGYFMYRARNQKLIVRLAYALIIAGAAGNLVDRIAFGYVRDFVEIVYFGLTIFGSKSFAIFNIADAELVIGVIVFMFFYLFVYRESEEKNKDNSAVVTVEELDRRNETEGDVPTRFEENSGNDE